MNKVKAPLGVKLISLLSIVYSLVYLVVLFISIFSFNNNSANILLKLIGIIIVFLIVTFSAIIGIFFWKGKLIAKEGMFLVLGLALLSGLTVFIRFPLRTFMDSLNSSTQAFGYFLIIILCLLFLFTILFPLFALVYLIFNKRAKEFFKTAK